MPSPTTRDRQSSYILEMMQRLGIEPGGGVVARLGLSYATAFRRCGTCACKQACRDWIDHGSAAATVAPRFCPNADIFFELRAALPCDDRAHALHA